MNKAFCVKVTRADGSVAPCNMNDLDLGYFQVTFDRNKAEQTAQMLSDTFNDNQYQVVEFEF